MEKEREVDHSWKKVLVWRAPWGGMGMRLDIIYSFLFFSFLFFSFLSFLFSLLFSFSLSFFPFSCFLWLHQRRMEVPRLRVESEVQLPAYTTATATRDLSCISDLHHNSWQMWFLNPLRKARDQTCVFVDTSQVCNPLSHNRNSLTPFSRGALSNCLEGTRGL